MGKICNIINNILPEMQTKKSAKNMSKIYIELC